MPHAFSREHLHDLVLDLLEPLLGLASKRTTSTGCVFDARTRPQPSPNLMRRPSIAITS
jgi:hypothetical protein